jgi:acetyltransferase AlgX (SGNH hydrolase-like protein)
MSIKKIAKLLLKLTCSVIFILISLEFLMIVFEPYLFKGFLQYDPDLGFRMRPNFPSFDGTLTNEFGFNDRDYPHQKTPGTFRIEVVGDSFSWAGGRDGNYTALLERMFEHRDGAHLVDVVNTGYPMTHTGEELAMLRKYGLQYNPDMVVLGFFVGNDFLEADPDRKRIIVNGLYIDISKSHEHIVFGYPIIPQSRLLLFIQQKYLIYQEAKKAAKETQDPQKPQATFAEDTYLQLENARLQFFNTSASRAQNLQANVDLIFHSITEMDALLKSRSIKLVVAIYPDEFQVNESLRKAVFDKFKLRPEDYDLNLAQNLLKSFLESKGIPFIDLSDRFRAEGQKRDLYLLRDTHWNSAGNQLAADMLFDYLDKRVPKPAQQGPGK